VISADGGSAEPGRGGGGRWLAAILAAAVLLVLLAVLAVGWLAGDSSTASAGDDGAQDRPGADPGDDPGSFFGGDGDELDGGLLPDVDALFSPDSLDVGDSSVWVSDSSCGLLVRIDLSTEEILGAIDLGGSASGVAIGDGSVWVGDRLLSRIVRLDPETITVVDAIPVIGVALGLDATDTEVWATDPLVGAVYQVDVSTGELTGTFEAGLLAHEVSIGEDAAWVANFGENTVSRIDRTGQPEPAEQIEQTTIPVGAGPLHVVEVAGSAWVTNSSDGTVSRIDRATGEVTAVIEVGPSPHALAFAAGSVWVGTEADELWRIDPESDEARLVEAASFSSIDMAVDGTQIWSADAGASRVVRFDAETGSIASTVDLASLGTCDEIRGDAERPSTVPQPIATG
jgi:YVTN family beta-propeller protein